MEKQPVPVAVSVVLKVPTQVLEQHAAASPELIGRVLADKVDEYVWRNRMGYYPALGYFIDHGGIDEQLLEACSNVAWLAKELVQEEVYRRLNKVFDDVGIAAIRSTAFTMPRIRPQTPAALAMLANHFTPDSVKTTLLLEATRGLSDPEKTTAYTRRMLWRWLKDHFSAMEVTSARVVSI